MQRINTSLYITLLTCLLQVCFSAHAQQADPLEQRFQSYANGVAREKIFAHVDKNAYAAGELMWFKLWVVDAADNRPLSMSKVAYVELLDTGNEALLRAKIFLKSGTGDGSFLLPLNIPTGCYALRCYTNWMKNFGTDDFFEKQVTIVNVQRKLEESPEPTPAIPKIQFLPEGGNLVDGIASRVAFIATDGRGHGADCNGYLLDNTDTLLRYRSIHAGMGTFSFTPIAGHVYRSVVTMTGPDSSITTTLPAAYGSGYVMNVRNEGDHYTVSIGTAGVPDEPVYLFIQSHGVQRAFLTATLEGGRASFTVDKSIPGTGVSVLTLFNGSRKPVCERLVFKRPPPGWAFHATTDRQVYGLRSLIHLGIGSEGTDGVADTTNASLAVYRLDSLQEPAQDSYVDDYLLLDSDLKGVVEDPSWYLADTGEAADQAIDNLMLVNGWRRFRWEDVLQGSKPDFRFVPEYGGPIISGQWVDRRTGRPAPGILTYMGVENYLRGFSTCTSDSNGMVNYELRDFRGPGQLVFQAASGDSNYNFLISDPFSNRFRDRPRYPFRPPAGGAHSLEDLSISMQVQQIYHGASLIHFRNSPPDSTSFYTDIDKRYFLDDYTRFTTMEEVLREYVVLVDVKRRAGHYHLVLYDFPNATMFKSDPLVVIDGIPVLNMDAFIRVDPLQLKKLEVVNRRYFLGDAIFNGILNWTSNNHDLGGYELNDAAIVNYDGLQQEREFYAPAYPTAEDRSGHTPDYRNVLLWKPELRLTPGKKTDESFYSSDLPGTYRVVLQGIANDGSCGKVIGTFRVQ